MQSILDPCCGSRMMWFDKQDQRCLFGDLRTESHYLKDRGNPYSGIPPAAMAKRIGSRL